MAGSCEDRVRESPSVWCARHAKKLAKQFIPHYPFVMAMLWGLAPFMADFPVLNFFWVMFGLLILLLWQSTWRPLKPLRHLHPENIEIAPWMSAQARYAIARAQNNGELLVAFVEDGKYYLMTLQQLEAGVHPNLHAIQMMGIMANEFYTSSITPNYIRWCYDRALRGKALELKPDIGIDEMILEFMAACEPAVFPRILNQFVTEISQRLDRACQI